MTSYLLYLYTESPLHAGGSDAEGSVDLPIQREGSTGYPLVWGQSLKGALRQAAYDSGWSSYTDGDDSFLDQVFGRAVGGENGPGVNPSAGLLTVGDAQLVALPVPALHHGFAWATSPVALGRLARKHTHARTGRTLPGIPQVNPAEGVCATDVWADASGQVLGPCLVPTKRARDGQANPVSAWADLIAGEGIGDEPHLATFANKFRQDLIVVGADVMAQLLRECTEHTVRVQLDPDTKTVKNGPFTSEYLPAETVLAAVLTLRDHTNGENHRELLEGLLDRQVLQIGGDETLGKGLVWSRLVKAVPGE
ncbi:type III-B CRISPR module RAMP protein Cmr4 [Nocardiopsis sp. N85]|uniref:type III-B CRISPR module RAMP protein Cmr4 n=1 Tax=Nocardiopsis sp. N85 TaxID=3029400 RepID=UPI00237F46EA|nr:type III-B CRISPR module RAMP protein Cmr4 [Nocardiopsis sp. N85]MDE3725303.1 type III-B CRISPR module RAMP protein Cmr4 [Nocardiopsis sp. N85]